MRKRTQGAQTRWRRASSIFTYWMGSRFVVENYRTGDILSAKPITARVLHLFGDWRRLEEVCRELPEFSAQSIRDGIRQLVKNGLLVSEGSAEASDDQEFRDTWPPGPPTPPFCTSEQKTCRTPCQTTSRWSVCALI